MIRMRIEQSTVKSGQIAMHKVGTIMEIPEDNKLALALVRTLANLGVISYVKEEKTLEDKLKDGDEFGNNYNDLAEIARTHLKAHPHEINCISKDRVLEVFDEAYDIDNMRAININTKIGNIRTAIETECDNLNEQLKNEQLKKGKT